MTKKSLLPLFYSSTLLLISALPVLAGAGIPINIVPEAGSGYEQLNNIGPASIVRTIITLMLGASGVISFIFLLWGGLQWIMAGGDKDGIDKARKKMSGSLIGLA